MGRKEELRESAETQGTRLHEWGKFKMREGLFLPGEKIIFTLVAKKDLLNVLFRIMDKKPKQRTEPVAPISSPEDWARIYEASWKPLFMSFFKVLRFRTGNVPTAGLSYRDFTAINRRLWALSLPYRLRASTHHRVGTDFSQIKVNMWRIEFK